MDPEYSLQDVVRCHLCETPVPPLHCVICKLHLCKACVGEHISDLSKEHIMVAFGKRRSTPIYTKCPKHSTKHCELFCEQCDIPICVHCTSSNEHLEHKTVDILKSFEAKREVIQRDLTDFEELIYPKYQDIASSIPVQKADWDKNSQKLRSSINKQEQYLHKEIENISQKKKSELDDMDSKLLNVLNKQEDKITHNISEITQSIADAKKLLNSNDVSLVSSYKSRNAEFRRLPPKLVASLPNLTPKKMNNEHLHQHFGSLSALSIKIEERSFIIDSPSAKSSLMNTPLFNEPRIITVIKTQYGTSNGLRSLSCLSDDVIWMSGEEKFMRLYNLMGKQVKSVQTKSGNKPRDIAVTRSGDLIYSDYDDRTVNIIAKKIHLQNTQIQTVIKLQGWKPHCVCSTASGDLLVVMDSDNYKQTKVARYSGSIEKQSIQYDDNRQFLYSYGSNSKCITENKNLDICVSDYTAGAVVVVNQAGKLQFTYTDPHFTKYFIFSAYHSFGPTDITTDSQGRILIADYNNDLIHILDQDGKFLRFIDNSHLWNPCGLCVNTTDNLFVAEWDTGNVKKIQYSGPCLPVI